MADQQVKMVLAQYGMTPADFEIHSFGSGYIHKTYKVQGRNSFILQRVNKNVFRQPELIAANIRAAATYIQKHHPQYLFTTPIPTVKGQQMAWDNEDFPWRLFRFIENTYTVDRVETAAQAFSAAAEFAKLVYNLDGADLSDFGETIKQFHDLHLRYEQLEQAITNGKPDRLSVAGAEISHARSYKWLVEKYDSLISSGILEKRITHNDTKINNVLFDSSTGKAVAAIDLDTLMPGYCIYDIGDMIRTFVSPEDESESDLSKISVREDIYVAIIHGYLSEMGSRLSARETQEIPFSGMMMTYIMAIRMLADYLLGDVYYQVTHPEQNLVRSRNQLALLDKLQVFNQTFDFNRVYH
jgi:thiamine kinase-like enzyme